MSVDAAKGVTSKPIVLKQKSSGIDANFESTDKKVAEKEVLVFANKVEAAKYVATAPTKANPVREQATAVVSSLQLTPLFEYANRTQNEYNANQTLFNFEQSVASAKLTEPNGSNSSSDKKDEGNQFLSARKSIADLRYEKFMEGDIENIELA